MFYYKFKDNSGYGTSMTEVIEDEEKMPITKEEYEEAVGPEYQPPQYTREQKRKMMRISWLMSQLNGSDYKAIKYAEGEMTEEEYAPVKEQRRQWRAEINQLQAELDAELNQ